MPVLSIDKIEKNYGSIKAVNQLSLDVEQGNIYGILGPNGSGKTTTLGIILGIIKASGGTYQWFGGEYSKKHRKKIGAMLETPNFYPYMNAVQNLKIVAGIKEAKNPNIDELLEIVNLSHRKKSSFKTYSLGMKQRLGIAATLIGDPEVLIYDEPTNGLDPEGIAEVRHTILKIAQSGKTILMASHILAEVEKICTHVAILKRGNLLASGAIGSIINDDIIIELGSDDISSLQLFLQKIEWLQFVEQKGNILIANMDSSHTAGEINQLAWEHNIVLTHLLSRQKSLEAEFMEIVKK